MYSATRAGDKLSSSTSVPPYRRFSLEEIQSATEYFDDDLVIGEGGFGKVYKGKISSGDAGHVVAIKRLSARSNQGEHEFRAEIETLSKLRHCHLVSLIGYCDDKDEMILVYEYMPNGTLYNHLHKRRRSLSWVERIKIAIGAGRGLDYLHTGVGTKEGIIHRDVKSSNILLDENMEAMIADFGLSKLNPIDLSSSSGVVASVKGTFGYLDPEYFYTKKLSRKTDVYAFGVVLFELLSGRLAVDERLGDEQCSLVRWAKKCVKERKLDQMVDSSIKGTVFRKCLRRFAQIADSCVHITPKERPDMTKVVASLHVVLELQLKFDSSAKSSGIMGFTWKARKHLPPVTKQNSEKIGTSASTNPGKDKTWSSDDEIIHQKEDSVLEGVKEFTYDELSRATRNFQDTCLGKGTGREIYKGWVDNLTYSPCNYNSGLIVAVKKFHHYKHIDWQMLKECNHPNLVKLIGYCMEDQSLFLVYEFMHNGNFEDLLRRGVVARLPLVKKVQIAFGVARGILFLQKMQLYFGTYQENWSADERIRKKQLLERRGIMLNKNFVAKFSDYGVTLKRIKPSQSHIRRTMDDFSDHVSTPNREPLQMDLSGFTVILAELVTGKNMNENELNIIDEMLLGHGKLSLRHIATSCYESCYEVESESKMLEILKEYSTYIPALENCKDETCYTTNFDDHEVDTFYTATSDQGDDDAFSTATLDRQDDTFCTATSGEREDDTLSAATLEHQDETFSTTTLEECQDETFSVTSFESCL